MLERPISASPSGLADVLVAGDPWPWHRGPVRSSAEAHTALAREIDAARATEQLEAFAPLLDGDPPALALAVLLSTAYPALGQQLLAHPGDARTLAAESLQPSRSREAYLALLRSSGGGASGGEVASRLRVVARRERARIALRELLRRERGGADVDTTAEELAWLADATIEVALEEALGWATSRFGRPVDELGRRSGFVVLGMGKLGGLELNPGSDVDLVYFYDTDEGGIVPPGAEEPSPDAVSPHEYWTRVARRLTATLEEPTSDGFVWRVDLRLRPEGGRGPLVNSIAAALRYYESFGRLWERAALLRARPVAGDLALGERILHELSPFVWRKAIDPSIAHEMASLVQRSRVELSSDAPRDLKLGVGGIREAEFFAQTLQLVWGGREPALRSRRTLDALARLQSKGFCTTKESEEISDAYLFLRRAEHAVQVASGQQTHLLPEGVELARLARSLGFADERRFSTELDRQRRRVSKRFASLRVGAVSGGSPWETLLAALERQDELAVRDSLRRAVTERALFPSGDEDSQDAAVGSLARQLAALARPPDGVLGGGMRERYPGLAELLLDALFEAADPFQAALYLRTFLERVRMPAVYVRLVFSDPTALRRLVSVLGASAFVGDALCNNPELGDMILFSREVPTPESAKQEVMAAAAAPADPAVDPDEAFVEQLRVAKTRITLLVALADLAGELDIRGVNTVLSAAAEASLEAATRRALGDVDSPVEGLSIVAMGKLGGRELSYGSDLDVLFLYDPEAAPDPLEAPGYFTRIARRIIRYVSTFHAAGPGYELDARLRPSGNQGLLVTSLESFARHHGLSVDGSELGSGLRPAVWERMALVRARAVAGDPQIGVLGEMIARRAAFGPGAVRPGEAREVAHIRSRVERESSLERAGVVDVKLGRGGLLDVEFAVQLLQIHRGAELGEDARSPELPRALDALERVGVLDALHARVFRDAWRFFRKVELRLRVARADASAALDERGPLLAPLARRLGLRDYPSHSAAEELLLRHHEVADAVRGSFEEIVESLTKAGAPG